MHFCAMSCSKKHLLAVILPLCDALQIIKLGQNAETTGTNSRITGTCRSSYTVKICPGRQKPLRYFTLIHVSQCVRWQCRSATYIATRGLLRQWELGITIFGGNTMGMGMDRL